MATRFDAYRLKEGDNIGDPRILNARFSDLDSRLAAQEAIAFDADAAIAALTQTGLDRINTVLAPAFAEVRSIADVGVFFSAHSVTSVMVGTGPQTFVLDAVDWSRFAPAAYLSAMSSDLTMAMLGTLVSYDRETGTLVINVDRFTGSGVAADWQISVAAATDNATSAVEAAASAAAAAATGAEIDSDLTEISNYLDDGLAARNAAQTAQASAATSATAAAASKTAADADAATAAAAQTNAANSASAAAASAAAAAASSSSSATNAADALTFDNAAAASASGAATSAAAAAISATAAASSATAAATSATGAAASKTAADADAAATASDRTAIVAAGTLYGQVWLGAFATDPITDNVGGALVDGAAYLNTSDGYLKYYLTGAWTSVVVPIGSTVASVFGRTGSVSAASGDYNTGLISRTAGAGGVAGATSEAAILDLKAQIDTKEASSAFGAFGLTLAGEATAAAARTSLGLVVGTDVQAYDAELAALAGLVSAADRLPYFTGSGAASLTVFTTAGRALIDDADASAQRTTLGLVIGTNVQAYDATLLSLAALGTAADKIAYTTAIDTWAEAAITSTGRSLIAGASAAAMRTTLGLVPGTDVQAYDATLLSIAALGTGADKLAYTTGVDVWAETTLSSYGRTLIDDADATTARTTLGLAIGTDVQAYGAGLTPLAGLTSAADRLPYYTGSGTAGLAVFTAAGRAIIDDADASAQRTTLGLAIGTNVQAYDATLLSLATLGSGADKIAYTTAIDTWAETGISSTGRTLIAGANAGAMQSTLSLVPGSNVQAYDATLNSIAALGTGADKTIYTTGVDTWAETGLTAAGRTLIAAASAAAQVTALALTIGTNTQAYDATLTSIAALGTGADKMIYTSGVDAWAELSVNSTARTFLSGANTTAMRSTLGVAVGSDVQAYDATLLSLAALGTAANKLAYTTGVDVWAETALSAYQRKLLGLGLTSNTTVSGPTPNADTDAIYELTAQAGAAAFANPSGSPTDAQPLRLRIKDNGTAQALSFSSTAGGYRAGTDLPLPTTTVISKIMYLLFFWNAADSKWDYAGQVGNI